MQSAAGQGVSLSYYVKASAGRYFVAVRGSYISNDYAIFDLLEGTITSNPTFTGSSAAIVSVGDGWYRCTLKSAQSTVTNAFSVSSSATTLGGITSGGVLLWGAQLETGSTATPYQRVTTAFDVTEAGVPDVWHLYDDGGDSLPLLLPDATYHVAFVDHLGEVTYDEVAASGGLELLQTERLVDIVVLDRAFTSDEEAKIEAYWARYAA